MSARRRRRRAFAAIASLVATTCVASTASARHHREEDETEVAHEGPDVRLTIGPGYGVGTYAKSAGGADLARGAGLGLQLSAGSTVDEGIVVGGMYSAAFLGGGNLGSSGSLGSTSLNLIGPFVDVYPDATEGLHFGGMAGFASSSTNDGTTSARALGGGGLVFGGYDLWIGDDWSLGAILQLHVAVLHGTDDKALGPTDAPHTYGSLPIALGGTLQIGILYQ